MGYTNYLRVHRDRPDDLVARLTLDTKAIIEHVAEAGLRIGDWEGKLPDADGFDPILSEEGIRLNGAKVDGGDYETFALTTEMIDFDVEDFEGLVQFLADFHLLPRKPFVLALDSLDHFTK